MSRLPRGPTLTAAPTQRTARLLTGDSVDPSGGTGLGAEVRLGLDLCTKPASHFGECVPSSRLAPSLQALTGRP